MRRPFLQFTPEDVLDFRRRVTDHLRVSVYEAIRALSGYGTLDEIAQRRREMFAEIMRTRYRRVTAHMKAMDISFGPGTVRQTPKPPPMRRPSEEPE